MFYFPDVAAEYKFRQFCLPLPNQLLPWLVDRGLNVMVLPENEDRAKELIYGILRVAEEPLPYMGSVMPHAHPHFRPDIKTIILTSSSLVRFSHNIVLHEIGHAVDHLYLEDGRLVSSVRQVEKLLRKVPPLDPHCKEQDTLREDNAEQFASSFEAFFNERNPQGKPYSLYHTIHDIDEGFIKLMRDYFVDPFTDTQEKAIYHKG